MRMIDRCEVAGVRGQSKLMTNNQTDKWRLLMPNEQAQS